jgi:hypothetical protein
MNIEATVCFTMLFFILFTFSLCVWIFVCAPFIVPVMAIRTRRSLPATGHGRGKPCFVRSGFASLSANQIRLVSVRGGERNLVPDFFCNLCHGKGLAHAIDTREWPLKSRVADPFSVPALLAQRDGEVSFVPFAFFLAADDFAWFTRFVVKPGPGILGFGLSRVDPCPSAVKNLAFFRTQNPQRRTLGPPTPGYSTNMR